MWRSVIKTYVERHLRFYYNVPDSVKLQYGADETASKPTLVIDDSSLTYFETDEGEPPFRIVDDIPLLFKNDDQKLIVDESESTRLTADLYGGIFFLLSGFQELKSTAAEGDRFLVKKSLQGKYGFERIPLADYYFEILIKAINKAYNSNYTYNSKLPKGVFLSHDIDNLYGGRTQGVFNAVRKGALLKAFKGIVSKKDPWFNLQEIADLELKYNAKSTFFMLPEKGKHALGYNADYKIDSEKVSCELVDLRKKHMEIALHGSLGSHASSERLQFEKLKIGGEIKGVRFHFLKFHPKNTVSLLESTDLKYDCSLGFPDALGFRRGTARPFKLFNWQTMMASSVLEIPLHVMDTTLKHHKYLGLEPNQATEAIFQIFKETVKVNGVFSLLWHNNYFSNYKYEGWKEVYECFLKTNNNVNYYTAAEIETYFKEF